MRLIVPGMLMVFLSTCSFTAASPVASPSPDLTLWRRTRSPLFPSTWPPTTETTWVRYTFAYGTNLARLVDGEFVTNPLAKTECKGDAVKTTESSKEMTQAGIQGVVPLDEPSRLILQNEKPSTGDCVNITQLPDPNLPQTKELVAYYHAWFKYNGTFLGLIGKNHAEFIDWVSQNK